MVLADTALDHLDQWNEVRNRLGRLLDEQLSEFACIEPQTVPEGANRVYAYHYMRYLPEKLGGLSIGSFLKALSAEGVSCGVCGYGRLHQAPLFNGENPFGHGTYRSDASLPVTELLARTAFFAAPRFETATESDVLEYAEAYGKVIENADLLLEVEQEKAVKVEAASGRSINLV
jgi:dTDP-4-amino-4,6-dideoxygalactose transaminase